MGNRNMFEVFSLKDPQLRRFGWLIALGLLGIALLILPGLLRREPDPAPVPGALAQPAETTTPGSGTGGDNIIGLQQTLENSVAEILGSIGGVGKVSVRITLSGTASVQYERDVATTAKTTSEEDAQGGTRVITEQTETGKLVLVQAASGGGESPVVRQVLQPEVTGVLVVAEGAANSGIKRALTYAIETLLQVAPHQVEVLPMRGGQ